MYRTLHPYIRVQLYACATGVPSTNSGVHDADPSVGPRARVPMRTMCAGSLARAPHHGYAHVGRCRSPSTQVVSAVP